MEKQVYETCSPSGIVKMIADDPQDFKGAPLNLQIVGRPFEDEKVLAAMQIIDEKLGPIFNYRYGHNSTLQVHFDKSTLNSIASIRFDEMALRRSISGRIKFSYLMPRKFVIGAEPGISAPYDDQPPLHAPLCHTTPDNITKVGGFIKGGVTASGRFATCASASCGPFTSTDSIPASCACAGFQGAEVLI